MKREAMSPKPFSALLWTAVALSAVAVLAASGSRWFADRPVAWDEHDDGDVANPPAPNHLQELETALTIRDSLGNEADRILSLEGPTAAWDVNALDEVPCSTWFCARNHLQAMTADQVAAGPPVPVPRLPLTITKGKELGAASGFQIKDAAGRKFMLKFDVAGHLGMANAGELIGNRVFHAAGYNVPGAVSLELHPEDLLVGPEATFVVQRVAKRPLTAAQVREVLTKVARLDDGTIRAVAVPWIGGKILGGFDLVGVRSDDPNDRIPHQHRRSLRASWVLFAWLSVLDPSSINTIDAYVEEGGRHFVRHYFFDFGCAFGSATNRVQGPQQDGEYLVEVGRTLASLFSFGLYRRPFQDGRDEWHRLMAEHPALGYFPAESFVPDAYRTNRRNPAHMRLTDRDAYWGAKIVASFDDAQVAALVASARLPAAEARYLEHALRVRRDIIGRRYLRPMTAVESPRVSPDGDSVCFDDLAIGRGHADASEVRYLVEASDGQGRVLQTREQAAMGKTTCVSAGGPGPGTGYRVLRVASRVAPRETEEMAKVAKAARIHLRWRADAARFTVVGLERDE